MRSLFTPHTRRSRIIVSSVVPNWQVCTNERNSDTYTLQLSLPAVVAVCGTSTSVLSRRAVGCDAASSPRLALRTSFARFGWPDQASKQLVRLGANHRQKHSSFLFSVGDSVSRQEVSEAFCLLRPFLAAFLEFAHMTELYCHRSGVSRIDPTSRRQCSNLLLKCGFSCNHCNIWVQEGLRENRERTDQTVQTQT